MNPEQQARILQQLADALASRRLATPARIALDVVAPVGFLASQAALLVRPLLPTGRWHQYVSALSDQHGWELLHELVTRRDC